MSLHQHYADSVQLMSFRSSLEPQVAALLDEIASGGQYVGASNASIMSILYTLIVTCRARKVLQLGTFVGFSSLILGDALRRVDGRLITVDPDVSVTSVAEGYIRRANLDPYIVIVEKSSTDPKTLELLRAKAPFDIIYIDSLHNYDHARQELSLYWPLLRPSGFLCLDDASKAAVEFDTSGRGGVYKAVKEWLLSTADCEWVMTREPLWPHAFGVFLATKVPQGEHLLNLTNRPMGAQRHAEAPRRSLPYRALRKVARVVGLAPKR